MRKHRKCKLEILFCSGWKGDWRWENAYLASLDSKTK